MAQPRSKPYIYTTWLKKLLVGDNNCEWATWFKAHHIGYQKATSDQDLVGWKMKHSALLSQVQFEFEERGKTVQIEAQNYFKLTGRSGVMLAGQPDLITASDGRGIICDVKTGQPTTADIAQVMIYMWAVPLALERYKGAKFDGLVVYKDHQVSIPHSAIDENFKTMLFALITRVTSRTPARRVPSRFECGFCDITRADCEERIEQDFPQDELPEVPYF